MTAPVRLAIVATHPIQHFVPLYRALAETHGIELSVFFGSRIGLKSYFDAEMNRNLSWKMDLVSGYASKFLAPDPDDPPAVGTGISADAIRRALSDFAPDAVIVYGYSTPLARGAARIARSLGARTLMISDSELRQSRSPARRIGKALALPILLRRFDALLSVGDENERYYRHYGVSPQRIFRSPFPVDEDALRVVRPHRARHRQDLLAKLGIDSDPLLALFVGKLIPRKRPDDLIEALLRADRRGRPIHAVLAGDGILSDDLGRRAEASGGRVHMLGFVNVDQLPTLYAACDVVVHPSAIDPHPLICSEAACVGLPLILSDRVGAVGPTDVAQDGRNALLFPAGDVDALAAHLAMLADDPGKVTAMGRESLAIFETLDMKRSVGGIIAALNYSAPRHD